VTEEMAERETQRKPRDVTTEGALGSPAGMSVCPLCLGSEVRLLDELKTADLRILYKRLLGREVVEEFQGAATIEISLCTQCDLRFSSPVVTGSKRFYGDLQSFPWYYSEQRPEYDFASAWIKEEDRVLDIGCGRGAFSKYLKGQEYVGLEFNEKAVKEANRVGITVLNQPIEEFAAHNKEAFSAVCIFQVLEHIADLKGFLDASLRCLQPGGRLIVSLPSADSFMWLLRNEVLNLPPHHVTWWSDACLRNMVHHYPLELIQLRHEKLTNAFKQRYMSALVLENFGKYVGLRSTLVDLSLKGRTAARLSAYLGRLLSEGLSNFRLLPDGHSVLAVYQNKSTV
jgi:SAM-dependent methyltransferase